MAYTFTDENVREAIASGKPIVIDFWATWCGPCMRLAPVIDQLAEEYADRVVIGKYNVDEQTELGSEYRIMSIPTLLFFKNGEMIRDLRMTGGQQKANIEANIEKLIAL
ncbi:MAG: thioredoxin [Muribaculaceae bacterium]|nr:thioredoxin [Muribaculaceae bacterium]